MDMGIEELSRQINHFEHSNNNIKSQRPHIGQLPPMDGDQQMYQQHYQPDQMMDQPMPDQQPNMEMTNPPPQMEEQPPMEVPA